LFINDLLRKNLVGRRPHSSQDVLNQPPPALVSPVVLDAILLSFARPARGFASALDDTVDFIKSN